MLNDQNSAGSLILSVEPLRCIFSDVISNATKLLDIRPRPLFELQLAKQTAWKKEQETGSPAPRERNFVYCIYYLFIYLFVVNGGRGLQQLPRYNEVVKSTVVSTGNLILSFLLLEYPFTPVVALLFFYILLEFVLRLFV